MIVGELAKNTVISTVSSLVIRAIGMSFGVFLTNKIGAGGIGLYSVITSVYALGVSFSSAGYRLAVTRLAVEDDSRKEPNPVRLIAIILFVSALTGIAGSLLLCTFSEFICTDIVGETRCIESLKILSAALPFVAGQAVISAYLNAFYKVIHIASLQLISQITMIAYTVVNIRAALPMEECCEIVSKGTVAGEILAFAAAVFMLFAELSGKRKTKAKNPVLKPFIRIALPDALGYDLRSCLSALQHLLIPSGLKKSGIGADAALSCYGVLHGMALQVVLFPSCILRSLAALLVPRITKERVEKGISGTRITVRRILHLSIVFSVSVASVMFFSSENIAQTLYHNTDSAGFIRLFSPLVPIMYLDISVDSMLKGLDKQVASMGYNLIDSALSALLVWLLLPKYGILGYIIMVFVTETLNTVMSLTKLLITTDIRLSVSQDILIPAVCAVGSGAAGNLIPYFFGHGYLSLAAQIAVNLAFYVFFASVLSPITKNEFIYLAGGHKKKKSRIQFQ